MKYYEARRKKQVAEMLQTAAGRDRGTITNLLRELEPDKPTGIKRLLEALAVHPACRRADLQQAGLDWTPSRLLAAHGLAAIPGVGGRAVLPVLLNGPVTAVVLGVAFVRRAAVPVRAAQAQEAHGR